MSGRHCALTRRPWWQVALDPRRRRATLRRRDRPGVGPTSALLLTAAGLAGVLVGSSMDPGAGSALMVASSVLPPAVLGTALVRTRTALVHETRHRHRLAGRVAVSDEQLSRMGDRVEHLVDLAHDQTAETQLVRTRLRDVRVELATSRAALAGVREQAARARSAATAAVAARDEARQVANAALARADAAALDARRAEVALTRVEEGLLGPDAVRSTPRVDGQRSFASVDMRVFDAFVEADMADEDAVLDAPARRGRHAAAPALDPETQAAATVAAASRAAGRAAAAPAGAARDSVRDVA
ncbi:hypothetical protein [Aquipuribacter sp. MA13-6]|uniref:hypothetical protein n=1 Tax=unclassified Aquipuribacter TaxID=2635084 RepID=UPI003EEF559D